MTQPARAPRFIALVAVGFVLAACGGGGATPSPAATMVSTPAPPTSASPAASGSPAAGATVVAVADNDAGSIVVDGAGRSLYLFTRDTKGAGTSTCTGECATAWPPLLVDAAAPATAGDGLTGTLDTVTRDDGSLQVTLDGWPLYYFAGDAAAGDTNGQGLNDVWWLVAPDGSPIDGAAAGPDGY
jgi:predicted lipoprotein with Yx(FWY)xxD motif